MHHITLSKPTSIGGEKSPARTEIWGTIGEKIVLLPVLEGNAKPVGVWGSAPTPLWVSCPNLPLGVYNDVSHYVVD